MNAMSGFVNNVNIATSQVPGSPRPVTMQPTVTNTAMTEPVMYIAVKAAAKSTRGRSGTKPMSRAKCGASGRVSLAMGSVTSVNEASPTVAIRGSSAKRRREGVAVVDCVRGFGILRMSF
jgi:hypothetical protein